MQSSRITSVLQSIFQLGEPVHVQGATASARALILSRLIAKHEGMLLVLCANDDVAAELASDTATLALSLEDRTVSWAHFPSWEQSPYSPVSPSIRTRLSRTAVLAALTGPNPPQLLFTTLAALSQATLPQKFLRDHVIELSLGTSLGTRDQFVTRLMDTGYQRTDPVEDPGSFSVRGEIIDVFPPGAKQPVRIELFDDVVERMRHFDSASQRSSPDIHSDLASLRIPPAREVLINSRTIARVREKLKEHGDESGISRANRDPLLATIHEGAYPDHSELWAPFAYDQSATLLDFIPENCWIVWNDELSCVQEWDEYIQIQHSAAKEAPASGVMAPPLSGLYPEREGLMRRIRSLTKLYLDQVELSEAHSVPTLDGPAEEEHDRADASLSKHHKVRVFGNKRLEAGSRHSIGDLEAKFQLWKRQGFLVLVLASTQSQVDRIKFLLGERDLFAAVESQPQAGQITIRMGSITEGFRWPGEGLAILTEGEILGTKHVKKVRRQTTSGGESAAKDWSGLQALADLVVGDAVVHLDHGIGRYQGLVRLDLNGAPSDFLLIEYAKADKLYLPVYRLNVIQKYVGAGESIQLDRLGSAQFARAKEKVRNEVKKLAVDLVQLYAERSMKPGLRLSPRDSMYREFEARFAFDETPDQLKAIDDTLSDLESGKPMDRLICGDVGYGKTEVAIRAAFRAVSDGKQVAMLVPTTVLAHQHEQSFRSRLKDYPITIESISRFKGPRQQKSVIEQLSLGKVDIIIGTHRLLSKDVQFFDLGLVIVDEEQRFGVEHKEKLKALRVDTHVLTLTATPIPRTLHMALSGLREISLINTPPVDRLPIRTYVSRFDEAVLKQAIEFELKRGGQVFVVHNRVQTIEEMAGRIRQLVPGASITIGHGQMAERELEKSMLAFYERTANVLVCTAIIESGLDVPNANTIIINRADAFGLSQLYQIRGRVGRGQQRAYAYLFLPEEGAISEDAKKRLEVIQRFVELGSGFNIASHDLEIRGGGDLLGAQQSGHIAAVGFDLYTELLEEAIRELQGKRTLVEETRREPEIKAPFPAFLPETYVLDIHQRLSLYRRLSASNAESELDDLESELRERFGVLPEEAQNLVWLIRIKQLLKRAGVEVLTVGAGKASFVTGSASVFDPVKVISLISTRPTDYQLTPDSKLIAKVSTGNLSELFFSIESLIKKLLPPEIIR